jgi:mannosyltransferase OCH1-like enzyme
MNVLSAKKINPTYKINLYYLHKPNSDYFNMLSNICELISLNDIPDYILKQNFLFTEHICDLMRLELIYKYGGIYLDIDTVCVRSFDTFLNYECVMGKEFGKRENKDREELIGLCNAVLMGIPKNKFVEVWIDNFLNDYRPDWNYNCVQMPYFLSNRHPHLIQIEPKSSFFKYSWDDDGKFDMFFSNSDISDCYSLHLWEHKNYDILKLYDDKYIKKNNDTISQLYKKI